MTVINSQKIKDFLFDILLPRKCLGCGKEGQYICKDCEVFLSEVDFLARSWTSDVQLDIGCPTPEVMSIWEYEGIIEKAIRKIKYDGCYDIMNELAEKALEKIELNLPEDIIITYVPMWPKKERERGFNQAKLIAQKIGNVHSLGVHRLLEKIRDNRTQVGLGPKEREENVRGVFRSLLTLGVNQLVDTECQPQSRVQKNVLLIDDVYTTGATAKECVRVLRKAGVKNVWIFTLARKLRI